MQDLHVDVDAVQQLASSLNGIHDSLLHATDSFAAGAAAACSGAVADALTSFGSGWHDGRKTITDEVHDLAQAAAGAAQAYQETEGQIIKNAEQGGINTQGAS
ncbi:MAG: hypothetical protein ABI140_04225 [Jatrophihabitantaceae bacterium]